MTDLPDIKIKTLTCFPSNALGGTGIEVNKVAGHYVIDLAHGEFGMISAIPTSPTNAILTYDTATEAYALIPSSLLGGAASGISDAPVDSVLYGRRNASWEAVPSAAWSNARLAKTTNYMVQDVDNGKTIALNGGGQLLMFNVASGYSATHTNYVVNEGSTRAWNISVNGLPAFWLYPGQVACVFNQNNVWQVQKPGRWKAPNNVFVYVDAINGNDANDGLAAGPGNAVKTLSRAIRYIIKDNFDLSESSAFPQSLVTVQLADNASGGVAHANAYSAAHIAFTPVGNEGRCTILIQGNASAPSNVVVSDASGAGIGAYGPVNIQVRNLQMGQTGAATPIANAGVQAADGANIRLQGGVIFGTCSTSQISAANKGSVFSDGSISVVGGAANFAFVQDMALVGLANQTVTFSNAPAYSQQTLAAFEMSFIKCDGVTWTNGGTVTGMKYFARNLSLVFTATGSGTVIPGSVAGSADPTCKVG